MVNLAMQSLGIQFPYLNIKTNNSYDNRFQFSRGPWKSYRFPKSFVRVANVMKNQEHYKVLGLRMDASSDDVKQAFKRLALRCHPDINKSPDANDSFQSVRLAYEVLSSDSSRTRYDKLLKLHELENRRFYRSHQESEASWQGRGVWPEEKQHSQKEKWANIYDNPESSFSFCDEKNSTEQVMEETNSTHELVKHALFIFYCITIFGAQTALIICTLGAMLNKHITLGYRFAHLVAWLIGGHSGVFLILALPLGDWFYGKYSDRLYFTSALAFWIASSAARIVPLSHGAILALTFMCYKLHFELQ